MRESLTCRVQECRTARLQECKSAGLQDCRTAGGKGRGEGEADGPGAAAGVDAISRRGIWNLHPEGQVRGQRHGTPRVRREEVTRARGALREKTTSIRWGLGHYEVLGEGLHWGGRAVSLDEGVSDLQSAGLQECRTAGLQAVRVGARARARQMVQGRRQEWTQ